MKNKSGVGKGKGSNMMIDEQTAKTIRGTRQVGFEINLKAIEITEFGLDDPDISLLDRLRPFIEELEEAARKLRVAAHSLQVKMNEKTRERCKRDPSIKKAFGLSYGHDHKGLYPTVEENERIKVLLDGGYLGKWGM